MFKILKSKTIKRFFLVILSILILMNGVIAISTSELKQEKINFTFSNLNIIEKNNVTTFEIKGTNSMFLNNNHYVVPTTTKTFTFPVGTQIENIQCTTHKIHTQKIKNDVKISPNYITSDYNISNNGIKTSKKPISINEWYDYKIGTGLYKDKKCVIVTVQIFPIQYYPSKYTMRWAEEINIIINYHMSPNNYNIDEEYNFVILTPTDFTNELEDLVTHKTNRGIATKLVTLDEIYEGAYFEAEGRDQQEQIKYFIKNAYDTWGISNVLLVGGKDYFPVRISNIEVIDEGQSYECQFVSDLYYADLYDKNLNFSSWDTNENNIFGEYNWVGQFDEVDLYPDVHIGRLACINDEEVTTTINKIITYENNDAYTKDWFAKFTVVGGDTAPGDDEEIDEGEFATETAINIMNGFIPIRIWASNADLYSKKSMNNAFNDGSGFLYLSGHGHRTIWATHPHENHNLWLPPGNYRSSDVLSLTNDEKLPVVILDACYVGQFNKATDCFSWSFLSNSQGGGIGVFSSTHTSFFYPTSYVTQDIIGKISQDTIKAYKLDGSITLGEMWTNALIRYISSNMDSADYFTVEEWLLMGDPTLSIAKESTPPNKPIISGPSSGKAGDELIITASATDIDGDRLHYLFDWGNDEFSEWIGPYDSGQTVEQGHIWDEEGTFEIRVIAKDNHGVQSEWSDPLVVSMPKNKVINTPFLRFLENHPNIFPVLRYLMKL